MNLKVCKSVFWLKFASVICFICSAVWVCVYALALLPGKIAEMGAEGMGAVIGILGAGIAIAVVIVILMLIACVLTVLLLCALALVVKERKYSPYNESGETDIKKYIGFRIAADVIFVLAAAVLLWIAVPFGVWGLPSTLTAGLGFLSAVAAEIVPLFFKGKDDKAEEERE